MEKTLKKLFSDNYVSMKLIIIVIIIIIIVKWLQLTLYNLSRIE